jgi:hypothetical protein
VLKWDSDRPRDFAYIMLVTVSLTTIAWLLVTWMTRPEPDAVLATFYRRVRPQGPGWKPVAASVGPVVIPGSLRLELINALLGCVLVYGALFGVGEILLRSALLGFGLLAISALAATAIARNLARESATGADLSS